MVRVVRPYQREVGDRLHWAIGFKIRKPTVRSLLTMQKTDVGAIQLEPRGRHPRFSHPSKKLSMWVTSGLRTLKRGWRHDTIYNINNIKYQLHKISITYNYNTSYLISGPAVQHTNSIKLRFIV